MTYIILVAGTGSRLQPLTSRHPKCLYKLDNDTTLIQRTIRGIRKNDKQAEIVVVTGYLHDIVRKELIMENVKIVCNPFYSVTGSVASLWFAKEYLQRENVTIINGDVVFDDGIMKDIICISTDYPYVLIDSSVSIQGKYNVEVQDNKVCVMSSKLKDYYAIYAGVTKLDAVSARFVLDEVKKWVTEGVYLEFYEDALVQMIFTSNFELYYKNIQEYKWREVDNVDDLVIAKHIHQSM